MLAIAAKISNYDISDVSFGMAAHTTAADGIQRKQLYTNFVLLPRFRRTVQWMIRVRPYAWHWFEEYTKKKFAPNGAAVALSKAEFFAPIPATPDDDDDNDDDNE